MGQPSISIVIPVLNEATQLPALKQALTPWMERPDVEVLLVDGGSQDATLAVADELSLPIISAPCGRSLQMNAGAKQSTGQVLLFLHADTVLPQDEIPQVMTSICDPLLSHNHLWGRFDIHLDYKPHVFLWTTEWLMNWRSRKTGVATGDQAIFVRRDEFERIKGFPEIPLMEDIAISKLLRAHGWPVCLTARVSTSTRRWLKHGTTKTMLLMWWLRFLFWRGVPAGKLAQRYYPGYIALFGAVKPKYSS